MRSLHTPKLHLPSRAAQICRFTSQPYGTDVRQRRTSVMTSSFQSTRPPQSSTPPAYRLRLEAGDELGHYLCCSLWLLGQRNALSGPQRKRFDITGGTGQRRRGLVPED